MSERPLIADPRRAELVIDLGALRRNVERLREVVAPAEVMVVVKADGYGHGMIPSARAARAGGATWLGVALVGEALALRESGDDGRILCWLTMPTDDLAAAVEADLDVTASAVAQVEAVATAARTVGRTARLQLKVDTGLSRGGAAQLDWPVVVDAAAAAQAAGDVRVTGVWSHFACSDEPGHPANDEQERRFGEAVRSAEVLRPESLHLANSAAALLRPSSRLDLVRCGLAAYGLSPAPDVSTAAAFGLEPVMTARARVAVAKDIAAGEGVSYGHTYVAKTATRIAVVPTGYAEGIPVAASSVAPVQVADRRHTVSGRVCMDQFVVDVGDQPVQVGDEVVLFGPGRDGEPTAEEWAQACGTIVYEIVTRIGGRFARTYVEEQQ